MGTGTAGFCERLPMEIPECETCGNTLEFFRGIKRINPALLFGECDHPEHECHIDTCFICDPPEHGWLMWVGEQYYTMQSFIEEAQRHGISKRIARIPTDMENGDRVYLAYRKCFKHKKRDRAGRWRDDYSPGIFFAFTITDLQKVLSQNAKPEEIAESELQRITPVIEYDEGEDITPVKERVNGDEFIEAMSEYKRKQVLEIQAQLNVDDNEDDVPIICRGCPDDTEMNTELAKFADEEEMDE